MAIARQSAGIVPRSSKTSYAVARLPPRSSGAPCLCANVLADDSDWHLVITAPALLDVHSTSSSIDCLLHLVLN